VGAAVRPRFAPGPALLQPETRFPCRSGRSAAIRAGTGAPTVIDRDMAYRGFRPDLWCYGFIAAGMAAQIAEHCGDGYLFAFSWQRLAYRAVLGSRACLSGHDGGARSSAVAPRF